jgi:serine/threonine-protein kinase
MYEAVTGQVPFDGNTFNELMFKIVLSEPPKLSEAVPDLDPKFADIINRAMARELDDRFASAAQLMQTLDAYLSGAPSATALAVPAGRAPSLTGAVDTGAGWADTNSDVSVPKRSIAPIVAAAVLGGVLVLGAGAFAAFKLMGTSDGVEPGAGAASAEGLQAPNLDKPLAGTPATPKPPGQVAETPEPVVAVAPTASAAPQADDPVQPAPQRKPVVAKRVVPKPAPVKAAPKPIAPSQPKPKPKPKSTPTDFGY